MNTAKNGDHYWVLAHVTPTFDADGAIKGFHSNRRKPQPDQIATMKPLYEKLIEIEDGHRDRKAGLEASSLELENILAAKGTSYDEFVLTL